MVDMAGSGTDVGRGVKQMVRREEEEAGVGRGSVWGGSVAAIEVRTESGEVWSHGVVYLAKYPRQLTIVVYCWGAVCLGVASVLARCLSLTLSLPPQPPLVCPFSP